MRMSIVLAALALAACSPAAPISADPAAVARDAPSPDPTDPAPESPRAGTAAGGASLMTAPCGVAGADGSGLAELALPGRNVAELAAVFVLVETPPSSPAAARYRLARSVSLFVDDGRVAATCRPGSVVTFAVP